MGSSADRVWICIKYALLCSHFGQVSERKKKISHRKKTSAESKYLPTTTTLNESDFTIDQHTILISIKSQKKSVKQRRPIALNDIRFRQDIPLENCLKSTNNIL